MYSCQRGKRSGMLGRGRWFREATGQGPMRLLQSKRASVFGREEAGMEAIRPKFFLRSQARVTPSRAPSEAGGVSHSLSILTKAFPKQEPMRKLFLLKSRVSSKPACLAVLAGRV